MSRDRHDDEDDERSNFQRHLKKLKRIYLDNAATSWPKPESVYRAVDHYQRELGAPSGRGAYCEAISVQRLIDQTRRQICELINASEDGSLVFTYSATDALCTAILGVLRDGDHVVTSVVEHNSVLRPLRHLEKEGRISVSRVGCDATGRFAVQSVVDSLQVNTRLVALTHASNVTGAIEPLEAIGKHCRANGIIFLVDAAQTVGAVPVDVGKLNCDILAASGHKGLLGPLGTGILYCSDAVAENMTPLRFGGTGSTVSQDQQPGNMPDKFEAGNLNVPGIVGLQAGLEYLVSDQGQELLARQEELKQKMLAGILQIEGVNLHGPVLAKDRTSVFSLSFELTPCTEVAAALDASWSIQTRAGLHCAPLLHREIGTEFHGGTVRLSIGLFHSEQEIDLVLRALTEIAAEVSA